MLKFLGSLNSTSWRRQVTWLVMPVVLMATGCQRQPTTYPVYGMVMFPDGKPLKKGTVEFEAVDQEKPITAAGEIGPDGRFSLGTYQAGDGAIPGKHRVAVIVDYDIGTGVERPDELPPPELDPKYRSWKTSGLEFTVERRPNNILVNVDRVPPPKKKK